jgi:hypothetical protein
MGVPGREVPRATRCLDAEHRVEDLGRSWCSRFRDVARESNAQRSSAATKRPCGFVSFLLYDDHGLG